MVGAVVVRRWVQWWRDGGCSGGEMVAKVDMVVVMIPLCGRRWIVLMCWMGEH